MAIAASPSEQAARIEQLCVAKRPASVSYQKCLMDQVAICERSNTALSRIQGAAIDCSIVMGLVAKDESTAAAKQGIVLDRTQGLAKSEVQTKSAASGWRPNQTPPPGTYAIDNILTYLPTPDPTSESQCVELVRQQTAEGLTALRDRRAAATFSEKWAVKGEYRDHLAKNSEVFRYVRAYAPSCLKSDLLVLQVWMEAIGQLNGLPYSALQLEKSAAKLNQARSDMQAAINARNQQGVDEQKAVLSQRKQNAIERGAPHLFGIYLGVPVQASMPRCDLASTQTCWSGSPGGQNEFIFFNDVERPAYLEDLDPTHFTPSKSPLGLCDYDDDDCIAAMTAPSKRGLGRIVAFDTVNSNVERIRFRIANDAQTIADVSEILSKRIGVEPEVSKRSRLPKTSTWRSNAATATLTCTNQGCLVVLQSSTFESAMQRRSQSERPL